MNEPPRSRGGAPFAALPLRVASSPTLQLLGRMLLHAAAVGVAVGVTGSAFVLGVEVLQHFLLHDLAGYAPLLAAGERGLDTPKAPFRPWLVAVLPGIGALLGGFVSRLAPETRGGGADALIDAFHRHGGVVRRRVAWVKMLASALTLGTGGSGGREGPTLQIGGAIGATVARALKVSERERRILLVAGAAAGMSAVFRTPLGAAILAVEVLHRDDFESDALVPAVLASVVSYSVFVSFFGEATLFAHAPRYPFVPVHLPLYVVMALFVSVCALAFERALESVRGLARRLPLPAWTHPGVGGLALGLLAAPVVYVLGERLGEGQGLGILGGGYGAAQVAITGASWLPGGWLGVELFLVLGATKLLATALTVGSGGSAGDFGPSMVMGGLFGGAFGHAASLAFPTAGIDPGAFALVGMATFYGGLAHVPLGSLVMTCELAGSYDLLVPLMLAEGVAFVTLRHARLYPAQTRTRRDSPAHRASLVLDVLKEVRVGDVVRRDLPLATFAPKDGAAEVLRRVARSEWQDAFPVLDAGGGLVGVVHGSVLRALVAEPDSVGVALVHDLMDAPRAVREDDDLHRALEVLHEGGGREVVVVDAKGAVLGVLDEEEIGTAYLRATEGVEDARLSHV